MSIVVVSIRNVSNITPPQKLKCERRDDSNITPPQILKCKRGDFFNIIPPQKLKYERRDVSNNTPPRRVFGIGFVTTDETEGHVLVDVSSLVGIVDVLSL
jgi:hypothetical protein